MILPVETKEWIKYIFTLYFYAVRQSGVNITFILSCPWLLSRLIRLLNSLGFLQTSEAPFYSSVDETGKVLCTFLPEPWLPSSALLQGFPFRGFSDTWNNLSLNSTVKVTSISDLRCILLESHIWRVSTVADHVIKVAKTAWKGNLVHLSRFLKWDFFLKQAQTIFNLKYFRVDNGAELIRVQ